MSITNRLNPIALLFLCIGFLFSAEKSQAQKSFASEEVVVQDFLHFLAAKDKNTKRVDQHLLPWKLSEVYANDSLWARVNETDQSRVLARTGWYGYGPLLAYDHGFTRKDFQNLKQRLATMKKQTWLPTDFPDSVRVLQEKGLNSSAYYAYSMPLVYLDKKLVLVKRHYHSVHVTGRWTLLEVYRIGKPGQYTLLNSYLLTNS